MASNFTCPPIANGLQPGAPRIFPLIMTIVTPLYFAFGLGLFLYYRNTSVFLRKRPFQFVLISTFGATLGWAYVPLRDYVGVEAFPCWLLGFCYCFAPGLLIAPLIFKDARYLNEVHLVRMGREMAVQRERSFRSPSTASGMINTLDVEDIDPVESKATLKTFLAHLRTIYKLKRHPEDRLRNLQFTRSPYFLIFWTSMICAPVAVAFLVRMLEERAWQSGCFGCDITNLDSIVLICFYCTAPTVGILVHRNRTASRDALMITRETQLCWWATLLTVIGQTLYILDPDQVYANGYFNWLELVMVSPILVVHLQTVQQVYNAHVMRAIVLSSNVIDREERFLDVQNSKELRQLFRTHLERELSSEIYLFMEAVERFRSNFEKLPKDARKVSATKIRDTFFESKSQFEINLSSEVRAKCNATYQDGVKVDMFDTAYEEIKRNLLADGFARFLLKIGPEAIAKGKAATAAAATSPKSSTPRSSNGGDETPKHASSLRNLFSSSPRSVPTSNVLAAANSFGSGGMSVQFSFETVASSDGIRSSMDSLSPKAS